MVGPNVTTNLQHVVLVVEDDVLLNMGAVEAFEAAGFAVKSTYDAETALQLLAEPFDVLFTDVHLPGMSGLSLAELACRRWPSLKLIVTSGSVEVDAQQLPGHGVFIEKPHRMEDVIDAIKALQNGSN